MDDQMDDEMDSVPLRNLVFWGSGLGAPPPEEPGIQPEVQSPFVPPASPELDEAPVHHGSPWFTWNPLDAIWFCWQFWCYLDALWMLYMDGLWIWWQNCNQFGPRGPTAATKSSMPSWPKLRLRCPRRLRRCQMWKRHRSSLRHREISFFSAEDVGLPIHNSSICCYLLFTIWWNYVELCCVEAAANVGHPSSRMWLHCHGRHGRGCWALQRYPSAASSPWHGPASYPNSLPQCWAWWTPSWWVISPALWI